MKTLMQMLEVVAQTDLMVIPVGLAAGCTGWAIGTVLVQALLLLMRAGRRQPPPQDQYWPQV